MALYDALRELNAKIARKIAEQQGLGPRFDLDLPAELKKTLGTAEPGPVAWVPYERATS